MLRFALFVSGHSLLVKISGTHSISDSGENFGCNAAYVRSCLLRIEIAQVDDREEMIET